MARYEGQVALARYIHRRRTERRVNDFADLLAEGFSVREAAERLGMKQSWGNNTLGRIRRGLGWQAC